MIKEIYLKKDLNLVLTSGPFPLLRDDDRPNITLLICPIFGD